MNMSIHIPTLQRPLTQYFPSTFLESAMQLTVCIPSLA